MDKNTIKSCLSFGCFLALVGCTSFVTVEAGKRKSKLSAETPKASSTITPSSSTTSSPSTPVSNTLAFTGTSSSTVSVSSRVFRDTSGTNSILALTGTCDALKGSITFSGSGLQSSTTTSCNNDGTFSVSIFHSSSSNSPKFWSYNTTLGLYGARTVTATQSSTSASTKIYLASTAHTNVNLISTPAQIIALPSSAADYNVLVNDIDMTAQVFTTIANFDGVLEGNGYVISNLSFTGSGFNTFSNPTSVYSNMSLTNYNLTISGGGGGIVQTCIGCNILNSSVAGTITNIALGAYFGGLAGSAMSSGLIYNSSVNIAFNCGSRSNCGGLVGTISSATLERSYSLGNITNGSGNLGGAVGSGTLATINNCYSQMTVSASGAVNATGVGGFIGTLNSGTLTNNYSTGTVNCSTTMIACANVDFFAGSNAGGTINQGYYPNDVVCSYTGPTACPGTLGTSATTATMRNQATFAGFDFTTTPIWNIVEGVSYPTLN